MGFIEDKVAAEMAQWQGFRDAEINSEEIALALTRPPKPDMGDLAFATFRFAKDAGMKPPELAAKLLEGAEAGALVESADATGPYLNIRLNQKAVSAIVLGEIEGTENYGDRSDGQGKTLVVDLSSPNIAKPLAVHHLRSTMIGYSIKKLRESQGWRVVGVNHLGDWGTGFGKLIAGLKMKYPALSNPMSEEAQDVFPALNIAAINEAYQEANKTNREGLDLAQAGREEFAELERLLRSRNDLQRAIEEGRSEGTELDEWHEQQGISNFILWAWVRRESLEEFERVYDALGLRFRNLLEEGISAKALDDEQLKRFCIYHGEADCFQLEELFPHFLPKGLEWGIAEQSDGAIVIYTHGRKKPPLMLRKADGASTYALRDMLAARYRRSVWGFDGDSATPFEMAYVVGTEQKLHFEQLFRALNEYEHKDPETEEPYFDWVASCRHVDFGLMLFLQPDGNWAKGSTRKGTAIMLEDLLDESVKAVREIMREKNPELADTPEAEDIAQAVGVGAVVFNDLKNGRRNNVKFDWEAVLDFQGESGPYMQMQYVRMGSVTEKFRETYGEPVLNKGCADLLELDEEWKIIQQLAAFPDAVAKASAEFEPSIVARHLIELASLTSSWWTATKDTRIVGDDENLSLARVRLVNSIRKVLGRGLTLLGMSLVERM